MSITLLSPGRIGGLDTPNRLMMAPMTRSRALPGGVPSDLAIQYYEQRASAGLIITEGIAPTAVGLGYARTPAIETPEQIAAWQKITRAVKAKGGRMFAQSCTWAASATPPTATPASRSWLRQRSAPTRRSGPTRSGCRTWTRRAR